TEIFRGQIDAGALQQQIAVIVGYAFRYPQEIRMNLTRVIERPEHRRPNALHVPQVKELVRDGCQEIAIARLRDEIVFADGDVCGVEMLDSIRRLRLNFEQEHVLFVWKLSEHRHGRFDNVLDVRGHLRRAHGDIAFAEDEIMPRSANLEVEYFEFAD